MIKGLHLRGGGNLLVERLVVGKQVVAEELQSVDGHEGRLKPLKPFLVQCEE